MKVKFKKLHENAVLPSYARPGDAGLDMFPVSTERVPHHKIRCHFGFSMEIPEGYVGLIFPRSSIWKTDSRMSNSVGVIDSGYRGEVQAVFDMIGYQEFYKGGVPVCQMIIMPIPPIEPEWADYLSDTERGAGGFGHTSGL
jgi:dUTP pyrophosphatase